MVDSVCVQTAEALAVAAVLLTPLASALLALTIAINWGVV